MNKITSDLDRMKALLAIEKVLGLNGPWVTRNCWFEVIICGKNRCTWFIPIVKLIIDD